MSELSSATTDPLVGDAGFTSRPPSWPRWPFGTEREVEAGDILFRAGDAAYDFIVDARGRGRDRPPDRDGDESVLATHGPAASSVS